MYLSAFYLITLSGHGIALNIIYIIINFISGIIINLKFYLFIPSLIFVYLYTCTHFLTDYLLCSLNSLKYGVVECCWFFSSCSQEVKCHRYCRRSTFRSSITHPARIHFSRSSSSLRLICVLATKLVVGMLVR